MEEQKPQKTYYRTGFGLVLSWVFSIVILGMAIYNMLVNPEMEFRWILFLVIGIITLPPVDLALRRWSPMGHTVIFGVLFIALIILIFLPMVQG